MDTARALLERGQAVVIFPEGTRIRTGSLARPKRGVGRLALQSGKPVVPIAVTGSEHARSGWRIKPVRVHIRCGPPLTFPRVEEPSRVPRRRGHRAHLAVRRAPVGVARRPAAAAHGGRGGRRLDGHRRRHRARARRSRSAARLPHRRAGRDAPLGARERALPARARARPRHRRQDRAARSSSPAWTSCCSPCRAPPCPPPSARSARAWATAPRCSWRRRASCRRSAPPRPPSWPSACAPAPSRRSPDPLTLARRSSTARSVVVATRDADLRRQLRRRARGRRPDC